MANTFLTVEGLEKLFGCFVHVLISHVGVRAKRFLSQSGSQAAIQRSCNKKYTM